MFVKPYLKHNRTTGERYTVYKLVEGYCVNGQVTNRIIVSFGRLEELAHKKKIPASPPGRRCTPCEISKK